MLSIQDTLEQLFSEVGKEALKHIPVGKVVFERCEPDQNSVTIRIWYGHARLRELDLKESPVWIYIYPARKQDGNPDIYFRAFEDGAPRNLDSDRLVSFVEKPAPAFKGVTTRDKTRALAKYYFLQKMAEVKTPASEWQFGIPLTNRFLDYLRQLGRHFYGLARVGGRMGMKTHNPPRDIRRFLSTARKGSTQNAGIDGVTQNSTTLKTSDDALSKNSSSRLSDHPSSLTNKEEDEDPIRHCRIPGGVAKTTVSPPARSGMMKLIQKQTGNPNPVKPVVERRSPSEVPSSPDHTPSENLDKALDAYVSIADELVILEDEKRSIHRRHKELKHEVQDLERKKSKNLKRKEHLVGEKISLLTNMSDEDRELFEYKAGQRSKMIRKE